MPLPSVCGRVCLHPCETACKRKELDEPIAIMAVKGYLTDTVVEPRPKPLPLYQGNSVAIVGSGPAGLAAAYDLIRSGYSVTVFGVYAGTRRNVDSRRACSPIAPSRLKRDIEYLKALGIEIKTNTRVDLNNLEGLLARGYGAVLLALGAHKGRKLKIPGSELKGCETGTAFMRAVNLNETRNIGNSVWVVGGGNVAIDCARSAVRLGAKDVHVACLEGYAEMPADQQSLRKLRMKG